MRDRGSTHCTGCHLLMDGVPAGTEIAGTGLWTATAMSTATRGRTAYFASLLIADVADIKTVQTRLRHGSATTTLRKYRHLWPDKDESTRATVERVIAARVARTEERMRNGEVVD